MGADTAIVVHQAPLFLCAPAQVETSTQDIKNTFGEDPGQPCPWPLGTILRISVLAGQRYNPVVLQVIKDRFQEWINVVGGGVEVAWRDPGQESDIRISFNNAIPSWSCTGTRSRKYGQAYATMNFNFTGWATDRKVVFSHRHINRVASHLIGHALGLPHAQVIWKAPWVSTWNGTLVGTQLGKIAQDYIAKDKGGFAAPAGSIMHFDLPASLSNTTSDDRQGSVAIDETTKVELRRLYPPVPICYHHFAAKEQPNTKTKKVEDTITSPLKSNPIIGLNRIDFSKEHNWRVYATVGERVISKNPAEEGYTMRLQSWDDTIMESAECDILTFASTDKRVQSGFESFVRIKGVGAQNPGFNGEAAIKTVTFPASYEQTPEVVAFISGFDVGFRQNLRVRAEVRKVSTTGFELTVGTWANTWLYDVQVFWLAYKSNDYSIRSGSIDAADTGKTEYIIPHSFKTPMKARPQAVFHGFTHIDLANDQNPRAAFEIPSWDANGLQAKVYTWGGANKMFGLSGSYVAIL